MALSNNEQQASYNATLNDFLNFLESESKNYAPATLEQVLEEDFLPHHENENAMEDMPSSGTTTFPFDSSVASPPPPSSPLRVSPVSPTIECILFPEEEKPPKDPLQPPQPPQPARYLVIDRIDERFWDRKDKPATPLPILEIKSSNLQQFADLTVAIYQNGGIVGHKKIDINSTQEIITVTDFTFSNFKPTEPVPFYFLLFGGEISACSQPCFITANAFSQSTAKRVDLLNTAIEEHEPPLCNSRTVRWTNSKNATLTCSKRISLLPQRVRKNRITKRLRTDEQPLPPKLVNTLLKETRSTPSTAINAFVQNAPSVPSDTVKMILKSAEAEIRSGDGPHNEAERELLEFSVELMGQEQITVKDVVDGIVQRFSKVNL